MIKGSEGSDELKGNDQHKRGPLHSAPQDQDKEGRCLKRNWEFVFLCETVLFFNAGS